MKNLTLVITFLTFLVACILVCDGPDILNAEQPEGDSALVVKKDVGIKTIVKLMSDAEYEETMLQMAAANGNQLRMWNVDDGVLIATYNTKTSLVTGITFYFCSDGPKANRESWSFSVEQFDPKTKRMNIILKNKD